MFSLPIYNTEAKVVDNIDLDKNIFDGKVNQALIYQVVLMYQARHRQGNAYARARGEVRGGGAKPWRQKGTGRARVSSIRSPIWRGGGTVFGPQPRDYSYSLPQKMRRLAIKSGLNDKLNDESLLVIDDIKLQDHKTKNFYAIFKKLSGCFKKAKAKKSSTAKINYDANRYLMLLSGADGNIRLACRNLASFDLKNVSDVNALDILMAHKMIISKEALSLITKELKK